MVWVSHTKGQGEILSGIGIAIMRGAMVLDNREAIEFVMKQGGM